MRKGIAIAAFAVMLALAAVGILTLRSATPVSADEVINRAYAAQTAAESQGIQHTQTERYTNPDAMPGPKLNFGKDGKSILDSYVDPQSGKSRLVVKDESTGDIIAATSFDGKYLYTSSSLSPQATQGPVLSMGFGETSGSGSVVGPVLSGETSGFGSVGVGVGGSPNSVSMDGAVPITTIYRIPQSTGTAANAYTKVIVDAKTLYEKARQDPNTKLLGEQTLSDGRKVYVVQVPATAHVVDEAAHVDKTYAMTSTVSFDAQTYQIVQQRTTTQQDGKEVVVNSSVQLLQETLPESTAVAWDLSDLKGVTVVDDANGTHGPQRLVSITQQELAAKTKSAYVLNPVPDGYTANIILAPTPDANGPVLYNIEYRDASGDTLVISGAGNASVNVNGDSKDTYTTRSGLKLNFVQGPNIVVGGAYAAGGEPAGGRSLCVSGSLTNAIVQTPDGTVFMLASNLTRDRVEALAEDLVPLK